MSSCEAVALAFQQLFLLVKWVHVGLEDRAGEALEEGVLEGLGSRVALEGLGSLVALGLVASSGPGKFSVHLRL